MDIALPTASEGVPELIEAESAEIRLALVDRVLTALMGDAERCEGVLSRADIDRTYAKRNLTVTECIKVERSLADRGVAIADPDDTDDDQDEVAEPSDNRRGRRPRYLTEQEERDCGRAMARAQRLTEADELSNPDYCAKVRQAAVAAQNKLVETNLQYVRKLVRQYRSTKHMDPDDLYQEGMLGLLRATLSYDPELGFRFKTYATWWIRQKITRGIADMDRTIRLPVHVQETVRKIRRAEQTILAETGKIPNATSLATYLGVDKERLARFLWRLHASNTADLDAPVSEDAALIDFKIDDDSPSAFDNLAGTQLHEQLNAALRTLTPREERIIRLRFGLYGDQDYTLEEIGSTFDVTRERIRQIEAKALTKLRHPSRSRKLEHFRHYRP